jgi:hypothetical protein
LLRANKDFDLVQFVDRPFRSQAVVNDTRPFLKQWENFETFNTDPPNVAIRHAGGYEIAQLTNLQESEGRLLIRLQSESKGESINCSFWRGEQVDIFVDGIYQSYLDGGEANCPVLYYNNGKRVPCCNREMTLQYEQSCICPDRYQSKPPDINTNNYGQFNPVCWLDNKQYGPIYCHNKDDTNSFYSSQLRGTFYKTNGNVIVNTTRSDTENTLGITCNTFQPYG